MVLLVQCTSPFIIREDIDGGGRRGRRGRRGQRADRRPVPRLHLARTRTTRQAGGGTGDGRGGGYGVNHDKSFRPRRQDRPQDLLETGAAYAMDAAGFRKPGTASSAARNSCAPTRPASWRSTTRTTWPAPARSRRSSTRTSPAPCPTADDIDAVVLDFDGTQTDDRVLIDSEGREFVAVHRGDGLGIAALRRSGLKMLILSTEQNPVVAARAGSSRSPCCTASTGRTSH